MDTGTRVPPSKWIHLQCEHSHNAIFDSSSAASNITSSGFTPVDFVGWWEWGLCHVPMRLSVLDAMVKSATAAVGHMRAADRSLFWFGVRREHVVRRDAFLCSCCSVKGEMLCSSDKKVLNKYFLLISFHLTAVAHSSHQLLCLPLFYMCRSFKRTFVVLVPPSCCSLTSYMCFCRTTWKSHPIGIFVKTDEWNFKVEIRAKGPLIQAWPLQHFWTPLKILKNINQDMNNQEISILNSQKRIRNFVRLSCKMDYPHTLRLRSDCRRIWFQSGYSCAPSMALSGLALLVLVAQRHGQSKPMVCLELLAKVQSDFVLFSYCSHC